MNTLKKNQLKELADDVFQVMIRYRDNFKCITCGIIIPNNRTDMHAGHFYSRNNYNIRYDEKNCHAQCSKCNMLMSLNDPLTVNEYTMKMIDKYGINILQELKNKMKVIIKKNNAFYEEVINRCIKINDENYPNWEMLLNPANQKRLKKFRE